MEQSMIRDPVSRIRQSFEERDGSLIINGWLEPGGALPPHFHPQQEERWSVVEGKIRFRLGDDERVIGPEDGEMFVAPNVVHGLASVTDEEARIRCIATPPLRLQKFLEEAAAAGEQRLFTPRGLPRGLRGARWAANFLKRYEDETVLVSPPRILQRVMIAVLARGS